MPRDYAHDYKSRCIYHITMVKASGVPAFSILKGTSSSPVLERTSLGQIIEEHIRSFSNLHPSLRILQYTIMPDHIHFVIFVQTEIPKSVGSYIGMMKVRAGQEASQRDITTSAIFEKDFYDRILRRAHSLDTICDYIRQNPYRLLIRRENPNFFRRINNIMIDGRLWQAYGNIQLLDNPFKAPVVIHRADSDEIRSAKKRRWCHLSENGGVLVSAFISPAEKEIRKLCEEANGKVILLSNNPLNDREKPASHDFAMCEKGRLLRLAPIQSLDSGRETFLYLNKIAEQISGFDTFVHAPNS